MVVRTKSLGRSSIGGKAGNRVAARQLCWPKIFDSPLDQGDEFGIQSDLVSSNFDPIILIHLQHVAEHVVQRRSTVRVRTGDHNVGAFQTMFFLDGVAAQSGFNQPDGIHPNARGVAVIVDRILPYVVRLLKSPE